MWWEIFYTALKRNGSKQLFFYLSNLDVIRFIEFTKTIEFLNVKKSIILELGCGYSVLPALLSDSSDFYICLDLSKNACKYQATLPNVSSVMADMQHLPFKAEVIKIKDSHGIILKFKGKTLSYFKQIYNDSRNNEILGEI